MLNNFHPIRRLHYYHPYGHSIDLPTAMVVCIVSAIVWIGVVVVVIASYYQNEKRRRNAVVVVMGMVLMEDCIPQRQQSIHSRPPHSEQMEAKLHELSWLPNLLLQYRLWCLLMNRK